MSVAFFCMCSIPAVFAARQSRTLEQALRLYNNGQDSEAIDLFMDLLTSGNPEEQQIAQEYINKMHNRAAGEKTDNIGVQVKKTSPGKKDKSAAQQSVSGGAGVPSSVPVSPLKKSEYETETKAEMIHDRVEAKLNDTRKQLIAELSDNSEAVYISKDGDVPQALVLTPKYFFNDDLTMKIKSQETLDKVAGLLFTMGDAYIYIYPAGAAIQTSGLRDLKEANLIYSFLTEYEGISPARVKIEREKPGVRFPKAVNLSGIILLLDYSGNKTVLKDAGGEFKTKGPAVSIGVYPRIIKNDGDISLIELSVQENSAGIPSWVLDVSQVQEDGSLLSISEQTGTGAMFNQTSWNGRRDFFGESYPPGQYIFTLTARDITAKESSVSKTIEIASKNTKQTASAAGGVAISKTYEADSVVAKTVKGKTSSAPAKVVGKFKIWFVPKQKSISKTGLANLNKVISIMNKNKDYKVYLTGCSGLNEVKGGKNAAATALAEDRLDAAYDRLGKKVSDNGRIMISDVESYVSEKKDGKFYFVYAEIKNK